MYGRENKKMEVMCNAREHMKTILIFVDFAKLCQFINHYLQLNSNFGKEDITFPLSSSSRAIEWRNKHLNEFESGVYNIDTRTYHDFTIYLKNCGNRIYTIGKEMRYTCDQLFRGQYRQLSTLYITLCSKAPGRYSFNLLIIITLFYLIYIEYETYKLSYNTRQNILYDSLFKYVTMGKWDDVVKSSEILINLGH